MIFLLEGVDGVGKSTLANEIAKQTKGHILHASYNPNWNIEAYHIDLIMSAGRLAVYQPVVIDRWAPSEFVYGSVFRGKPSYDVTAILDEFGDDLDMRFIYCRNDNAVKNHTKHLKERKEMFDDISQAILVFDEFIRQDKQKREWITYDYDKCNMQEFVKELL